MVYSELQAFGIEVRLMENMAEHTSFRTGGPAEIFVLPASVLQMKQTIEVLKKNDCPFRILGRGSNLLVDDEGVANAVVCTDRMTGFEISGETVTALAGESLTLVSRKAAQEGLLGLEFACGIPGSVGGAVVMNAGAYGGEMRDIISSVTVLTEDGSVEEIPAQDMEFGYRTSCVDRKKYIVLSAAMKLKRGNSEDILKKMNENLAARREKQPLEYPSAGSTFKRPEGMFAGKLIMDAGLRGLSVGDAQVSEKHCGFIINRGKASSADIKELIRIVQENVLKQFGVLLECELRIWP